MSQTLEIRKSTGITVSIAVLAALIVIGFTVGTWVSSVDAQLKENRQDIGNLGPEIKVLSEKLEVYNENLNDTNLSLVEVQTLIKGLQEDLEVRL